MHNAVNYRLGVGQGTSYDVISKLSCCFSRPIQRRNGLDKTSRPFRIKECAANRGRSLSHHDREKTSGSRIHPGARLDGEVGLSSRSYGQPTTAVRSKHLVFISIIEAGGLSANPSYHTDASLCHISLAGIVRPASIAISPVPTPKVPALIAIDLARPVCGAELSEARDLPAIR